MPGLNRTIADSLSPSRPAPVKLPFSSYKDLPAMAAYFTSNFPPSPYCRHFAAQSGIWPNLSVYKTAERSSGQAVETTVARPRD